MVDWYKFFAFLVVDAFIIGTLAWRIKVYSNSERVDTTRAAWQEFFIVGIPGAICLFVLVLLVLRTMELLSYAIT